MLKILYGIHELPVNCKNVTNPIWQGNLWKMHNMSQHFIKIWFFAYLSSHYSRQMFQKFVKSPEFFCTNSNCCSFEKSVVVDKKSNLFGTFFRRYLKKTATICGRGCRHCWQGAKKQYLSLGWIIMSFWITLEAYVLTLHLSIRTILPFLQQ